MALPLFISGCSLFPTTRKLPVPKAPPLVQSATAQKLVEELNERWNALDTLTATVEIQATELKSSEGVEKVFPSARGYIIISKPQKLRVYGTYFSLPIFDMASDGSQFTLVIPPKSTAIRGSDEVRERSPNQLENLRPDFFLDALVVRGLRPDEEFMLTSTTTTYEDAKKKHLYSMPEYILTVVRHKAGTQELMTVRQIMFHRDDLLPYSQQVYDSTGNVETDVTYSNYADFGGNKYPSHVVINRPIEGIQLSLTVVRVEENVKLPADEFDVKIPEGTKVRELK
jgi:outer membrane lipoprotein-sorting protein